MRSSRLAAGGCDHHGEAVAWRPRTGTRSLLVLENAFFRSARRVRRFSGGEHRGSGRGRRCSSVRRNCWQVARKCGTERSAGRRRIGRLRANASQKDHREIDELCETSRTHGFRAEERFSVATHSRDPRTSVYRRLAAEMTANNPSSRNDDVRGALAFLPASIGVDAELRQRDRTRPYVDWRLAPAPGAGASGDEVDGPTGQALTWRQPRAREGPVGLDMS